MLMAATSSIHLFPDGPLGTPTGSPKRSRCGAWPSEWDRLANLTRYGHLSYLGEVMGPHIGGTFTVWQITSAGRAFTERAGSARPEVRPHS